MDTNNQNKEANKNISVYYGISIAFQLGFLIVLSILGFLAIGFYVDKWLHTIPIFIIIGAILGLAIATFESYHLIKPILHESTKELEDKNNKKK